MSNFFGKDYLPGNDTAKTLFHEYAAGLPVIDYHCHLDALDIYHNKQFSDLTQLWLSGDHYKWRLMRTCGVDEDYITGNAPDYDKFKAFAAILPQAAGNPVYHWVHLELQRFFDINIPLSADTAADIWELTCDKLENDSTLTAQGILQRMNVEAVITTDDPADGALWHSKIADDSDVNTRVLPGFRSDLLFQIDSEAFPGYIQKLTAVQSLDNLDFDELKNRLIKRLDIYKATGCRAADHGLSDISFSPVSDDEIDNILKKRLRGESIGIADAGKYRCAMLTFLAGEYKRLGWVMELHLGVLRDVNSVKSGNIKPNSGFDCIGKPVDINELALVLSALDKADRLPKTLIFSSNPNDNAAINSLAACYGENGIKGKVQQGSAWWFNDTLGGIKSQLSCFAEYGVLGNFIGMLTDSRSFTSYVRHEYFRRILCNYLGDMVDQGLYPNDMGLLSNMVKNICYYNVKEYFRL